MAVSNTFATVTDANGVALCHSAGASKANADSRRKRLVRAQAYRVAAEAGMVENGRVLCAVSGRALDMLADRVPANFDVVPDLGHVTPDAKGGAWCPCNLLPVSRSVNLEDEANGNAAMVLTPAVANAWREAWRNVWASEASASKVARMA